MLKKIHVGNLPFTATEEEVKALFSAFGTVESVGIAINRKTKKPRGFCFVEMSSGAEEAIAALNDKEMGDRKLTVAEATNTESKPARRNPRK